MDSPAPAEAEDGALHGALSRVLRGVVRAGREGLPGCTTERLPTRVLEIIQHAPKYPEGRGVRLEVRNKKDLANVEALASIKMAN